MVNLATQAPEVQDVRLGPYIGTNVEQSNVISSVGSDLLKSAGDLTTAKQAAGQDRAIGEFAYNSILEQEQTARRAIAATEVDMSSSDFASLSAAEKSAQRLNSAELQNPRKAASTLRRSAMLRQAIANNPALAPELLQTFQQTSGQLVGTELDSVVDDVESRRKAYIEYVNKEAPTLGIPSGASFSQASAEVAERDKLRARAETSAKTLQILQDTQQSTVINTLNTFRSDIVPLAARNTASIAREILKDIKLPDGSIKKLTPEEVTQFTQSVTEEFNQYTAALYSVGGSALTSAQVEDTLAPIKLLNDHLLATINGDYEVAALEADMKATEVATASNLYAKYPNAVALSQNIATLTKGWPPELANSFGLLAAQVDLNRALVDAVQGVAADSRAADVAKTLIETNPTLDPTKLLKDGYSTFGDVLKYSADASPEVFGGVLRSMFANYGNTRVDPNMTAAFDGVLSALSDPKTLKRINEAVIADPETAQNINIGIERYLKDVESSAKAQIETTLNKGVESTRQLRDTAMSGTRVPRTGLGEVFKSVSSLVEQRVLPTGVVMYVTESTDPQVRAAVSIMNKAGQKIGQVSQVYSTLNKINNPQAVAESIINTGSPFPVTEAEGG